MSFAQEMTNLGRNFAASFDDRINFLGKNIHDVRTLFNDTHQMMSRFRREHRNMAHKQRKDLHNFCDSLAENVDHLLQNCKKKRMAIHREFQEGHRAFQSCLKTMGSKRRNLNGNVNRAFHNFERKPKRKH